jgi:hypothetical protein
MDPTNPDVTNQTIDPAAQSQETLDKSNVQKRIDELTAEKHTYARQVEQLTATVAEMLKAQNEQRQVVQQAPAQEQIPEGLDPAVAKFLTDQLKKTQEATIAQTQQLYWQLQHQMDSAQVSTKYAHLPPEVVTDAAQRYTALKQRYGGAATMDDAVALAHFAWAQKQGARSAVNQFNQMGQPIMQQGAPMQSQQSASLVSPASLPQWESWTEDQRIKAIDEWEKKGGRFNF